MIKKILFNILLIASITFAAMSESSQKKVLLLRMEMGILAGTYEFFREGLEVAKLKDYDLVVVELNTPGGLLNVTQLMVQDIFKSEVPVAVYVSPSGGTAASAGVFITMAAHVSAMAEGTSIGAAHPISGDGQDLKGDLKLKAKNMAAAMIKSISKTRGRNGQWAAKAVSQSSSLTADEAVLKTVVDFKALDLTDLLQKIEGKTVRVKDYDVKLSNFTNAKIKIFNMSLRLKLTNFLADPNIAALLWLVATTGIGVEIYSPGLIFPGILGVFCLILALISMQLMPLNIGGIILVVVGVFVFLAEMHLTSGILAMIGLASIMLGLVYLVDLSSAPGMFVSLIYVLPFLIVIFSALCLFILSSWSLKRTATKPLGGDNLLLNQVGKVVTDFNSGFGYIVVAGERWKAHSSDQLKIGDQVVVLKRTSGLLLEVKLN